MLGLVVCVLVLALAYPLREYLSQRSQIAQLTEQEQAQRSKVAALKAQRQRWEDPAYVKAQARQRLQYVMPGEVGYVVVDPDQVRAPAHGRQPANVAASRTGKDAPWYSQLWGTVPAADAAR